MQAAQLQTLRNSQQASSHSSKPHMLLELMLLRAEPAGLAPASLQSQLAAAAVDNSLLLGSSYDSRQGDEDVHIDGAALAAGVVTGVGEDPSCGDGVELLVLVSAASNVPLVPG